MQGSLGGRPLNLSTSIKHDYESELKNYSLPCDNSQLMEDKYCRFSSIEEFIRVHDFIVLGLLSKEASLVGPFTELYIILIIFVL